MQKLLSMILLCVEMTLPSLSLCAAAAEVPVNDRTRLVAAQKGPNFLHLGKKGRQAARKREEAQGDQQRVLSAKKPFKLNIERFDPRALSRAVRRNEFAAHIEGEMDVYQ